MTEVLCSPDAMQAWTAERHRSGRTIALVPTMGALHDGHLALIDDAGARADDVVVSIFVNPLQFNVRDDFERYPRNLDDDVARCHDRGVAAIYAPTAATMYPEGFETHIEPGSLAESLEGSSRPGHFRGVTTVVAKLFNAVRPDVAVFGQKDFQQLVVIRRMVTDLDMGIEIVGHPTVRESDGLAMSSRNARLTTQQRLAARVVPAALDAIEAAHRMGVGSAIELVAIGSDVISQESTARLDRLDIVEPTTLLPVEAVGGDPVLATIAVWFGEVRLIDNRLLNA